MQTIHKVVVANQVIKCNLFLSLLLFVFLFSCGVIAQAADITEDQIRDAILGKIQVDLNTMDLNKDGKVDVADLVYLANYGSGLHPLIGEHAGTMYRDNGALLSGMNGSFGQIPIVLRIIKDSPLEGEIDNSVSNSSLYFPQEKLQVTFKTDATKDLVFELTFETKNPNVAPESVLTRTVTFSGSFDDLDHRLMSGTYVEQIAGFKNSKGSDIPITLTGKFTLIFNGT